MSNLNDSVWSGGTNPSSGQAAGGDALARYQYLLRTAAPDQIEQAHAQAFAQMSAQERQEVLQALSRTGETPTDASAESLARSATRLEIQQPGALQQVLGSVTGGGGANLLASLAAGFIGSAAWSTITGGDGLGGRPGLVSRLFGGLMGNRGYGGYGGGGFGGPGGGFGGGFGGGGLGGLFGGRGGGPGGGGFFGGGRGPGGPGGPGGGGFFGGGPGGPGGPGGGPGGPGGGPGGGPF